MLQYSKLAMDNAVPIKEKGKNVRVEVLEYGVPCVQCCRTECHMCTAACCPTHLHTDEEHLLVEYTKLLTNWGSLWHKVHVTALVKSYLEKAGVTSKLKK
jgi:hypothetical protein